jgi:isopenicillin N synthase-like dioxygenase
MGATKYTDRSIPRISLANFNDRIDEITTQLVHAAETDGFFSITDTGITAAEIDDIFKTSESFFALPDNVKTTVPFTHKNVGWEKRSQVRPSTGVADQKESYQLQFGENMVDKWISDEALPGFKNDAQTFMQKAQSVSEKMMLCFARGLGFPDDYFIKAHDTRRPDCQSVLRLLHYFEVDKSAEPQPDFYRAGAHADWDLLTLLFQRPGQSGLEICPGREVVTSFGMGDQWTRVDFAAGDIVCNIGDLLMSWSDDRFKSTFRESSERVDIGQFLTLVHRSCQSSDRAGRLLRSEVQHSILQPTLYGLRDTRSAEEVSYGESDVSKEARKVIGADLSAVGHGCRVHKGGNGEEFCSAESEEG